MSNGVKVVENASSAYSQAKRFSGPGGFITTQLSNRQGAVIAAAGIRLNWHPSLLSLGNPIAAALGSGAVVTLAHEAHAFWWPGWLALTFWPLAYAFDCADGQLARATRKISEFGARVDVLADYLSQIFVVAAIAVVSARTSSLPIAAIAVICSLWFFGTFAATLRRSDLLPGHSIFRKRVLASITRAVLDTGLINLLFGAWMLASPRTIVVPTIAVTLANLAYLVVSLARETKLSLSQSAAESTSPD